MPGWKKSSERGISGMIGFPSLSRNSTSSSKSVWRRNAVLANSVEIEAFTFGL